MTEAEILGYLFGAYSIGYCLSYAMLAFKRFMEVST